MTYLTTLCTSKNCRHYETCMRANLKEFSHINSFIEDGFCSNGKYMKEYVDRKIERVYGKWDVE